MNIEILWIISLVSLFLIGNHLHDIAMEIHHNNLINGNNNMAAGNGFYTNDAIKLYHLGWYLMYFIFFILIVSYVVKIKPGEENYGGLEKG